MLIVLIANSQEQAGREVTLVNTNNDWVNLLRDDYLFKSGDDGVCLVAEIKHSNFVAAANNFRVQSRSILSYNPEFVLISKLNQSMDASIRDFADVSLEEYSYNEEGLLASTTIRVKERGRWILKERVSNTYNRSGNLERTLLESFNHTSNDFVPVSDVINTVDTDGSVLVSLKRNYELRRRGFVPVSLETFKYENGLLVTSETYLYDENQKSYLLYKIESKQYDHSNRIVRNRIDGVNFVIGRSIILEQKDYTYENENSSRLLTTLISKENLETGELENAFLIKHTNYCQVSVNNDLAITIYPNPGNILGIGLTSETDENVQVEVYDLTGKMIVNSVLKSNKGTNNFQLDTEALPNGMYLVKLNTKSAQVTKEWIKN
jgi:hypothetical protein